MFNSFEIPWAVAHKAPLSIGFPRQAYWSGLPFPSPGDLPNQGIKDSLPLNHLGSPHTAEETVIFTFYQYVRLKFLKNTYFTTKLTVNDSHHLCWKLQR